MTKAQQKKRERRGRRKNTHPIDEPRDVQVARYAKWRPISWHNNTASGMGWGTGPGASSYRRG